MPKTNTAAKSNTAKTDTTTALNPPASPPQPGEAVATYSRGERLEAFNIKESSLGAKFFLRCGTAWVNKDGSINLTLDTVPLDGKVHLRRPMPRLDGGPSQVGVAPAVESAEDAPF